MLTLTSAKQVILRLKRAVLLLICLNVVIIITSGIISKTHGKEPWQPNGLAGMAWEDRRAENG